MSLEALPEAIRSALAQRGGGRPIEALRTLRRAPLPSLDHAPREVPLWLVRTPGQIWLVGAAETPPSLRGLSDAVAVATGRPPEARVDRAFGRSAAVVAEVRATLARRDVALAMALLERFERDAGGPEHPLDAGLAALPRPLAEGAGAAAPGAGPFPEGFLEAAGPSPEGPWLAALEVATEVRLMGVIRDLERPVALGISETALRLVIPSAPLAGALELERAPVHARRLGRDQLESPGLILRGQLFGSVDLERAARMAEAGPGGRYALAVLARLRAEAGDDALELLASGLERGHEDALASLLAATAAALDDGPRAAAFLERALASGADPENARAFSDLVKQARLLPAGRARELLARAETPALSPVEGAPWPPRGPDEIWAVAAARPLGPTLALAELDRRIEKTRALRWRAALTGGAPELRAAANALRHDGLRDLARSTLARAQRVEPRPEEGWQLAAWAMDDAPGQDEVVEALEAALELDPEATGASRQLDAAALARVAERARAADLAGAAALTERADAADREAPLPERLRRAQQMERELRDAPRAARMLLRVAEAAAAQAVAGEDVETTAVPELAPGRLRLRAARAFLSAGDAPAATEAARAAVRDDFLHADVLRSAAALEGLELAPEERVWWRHLAEVLAPRGGEAPGLAPRPRLTALELDRLHPGGKGWLADLHTRISTPSLPQRDELVRGLERVEGPSFPELFRLVDEVSLSLGVDPVPTYVYRGDDAVGISGWPTRPPVLLVGIDHLRPGPRALDAAALRFAVAVELTHIAAGHPVLAIDDSLLGTSKSVYQAFGRFAGTAETAVDLVTLVPGIDQLAKLQKILKLSRRVFSARSTVDKAHGLAKPLLARILPGRDGDPRGIGHDATSRTALELRMQADRAALLLTGDVGAAARALLATTSARPAARLRELDERGLSALIDPDEGEEVLTADEALRLGALLEDAAQRSFDDAVGVADPGKH